VVAEVVHVDAEDDSGPVAFAPVEDADRVHQRRLAVRATVALIGDVGGVRQLVRAHGVPPQGPLACERLAVGQFIAGE
jgi:hypothetical protein